MLDTRLSCRLKIKFFLVILSQIISFGTNLQPANLQSNIYYFKYITLLFQYKPLQRPKPKSCAREFQFPWANQNYFLVAKCDS